MNYFRHPTAIVGERASVGEGTRLWAFVNIQDGARVGERCNICDCSFIEKGVCIGDDVTVKNGVALYEGVTLEDRVFVGPNVAFVNDRRPRSRNSGWKLEPTIVRTGASLGANATIMCGVEIGAYAVVGAGSVVLKDVAPHAVVVGNPARQKGWVSCEGEPLDHALTCPRGRKYRRSGAGLVLGEGEAHAA
jgi:acetyltransferase-like isoleucine patch superfamily enzyme